MNLLVTGAAGFIGSHVSDSLLAEGHTVVGLDSFDPFYDRRLKEANLRTSLAYGSFVIVEEDIRDADAMASVFGKHGPFDVVVHLAARAGVRPSIADPLGYAQVNMTGTMNLLELAAGASSPPRFIFASSSSVYGNNPKTPFSESDRVDCPISPYAATKKSGELICHTYHHLYGLPVYCLRFFTVYGPRQRPDLAIRKFAESILGGRPIRAFGDGTSSRDYTHIDDIVAGVRAAIDRCEGFEIVNLGGEHPITLRDMVGIVAAACEREPQIRWTTTQPGDVFRTFADIAKARELLGYEPRMSFPRGVRLFVEWLRGNMA